MGEAQGGAGRAAEKADAAARHGRLDLSVPQVAGSAVAAIVAAKLASGLGVYGTIVGAGVVSVLGTCGGSVLQHLFRRTGRHVQEVATQGRTGVRRVRSVDEPTDHGGRDGYGAPTSYRAAGRRGWKRPVVAVALAFGLTMGGITCYEALAGENISGHGRGTTVGDAFTGHTPQRSGGTGHTPAPPDGSTGTPSHRPTTDPRIPDTTAPTPTPSTTGTSTPSTPPPTSPPPTSTSPSPTATEDSAGVKP
ncbi:hypothetical protein AB0M29_15725 [Streptomyces sp. NPDC051976]|uniref:hypothetical protein n=1 Tax=Streptomyces sp. NPDC051976 TaxID=3154947 RepID=UPI00343C6DC8